MLRLALAAAVALVLSGCGHMKALDGYRFGVPTQERAEVDVSVQTYQSYGALRAAAAKLGRRTEGNSRVMAFATLDPEEPRCTIHVVAPEVRYSPEWLGHELAHCIYGQWHK